MVRRLALALLPGALLLALTGCHKEMDAREEAERQALLAQRQQQQQAATPATASPGTTAQPGSTTGTPATGTSGQPGSETPAQTAPGVPTTTQPHLIVPVTLENLGLNQSATLGYVTYTLDSIYLVPQAPAFPQGYGFVLVEITVRNDGPTPFTVNSVEHFILTDKNGKAYKLNAQAWGQRNPKLQGNVEPGGEQKGWLGYLLKTYNGDYTLTISPPDWGEAIYTFQL